jgi:hypothetical protein
MAGKQSKMCVCLFKHVIQRQRGYLEEKVAAPVQKAENMIVGIRHADQVTPSIRKS